MAKETERQGDQHFKPTLEQLRVALSNPEERTRVRCWHEETSGAGLEDTPTDQTQFDDLPDCRKESIFNSW